jgi:hypothetical protein
VTNEDRIPHHQAVWRPYAGIGRKSPNGTVGKEVSVERAGGFIELGLSNEINWAGVLRWRFGWPPR